MVKNVAIVGAGISGLLACKYALSKGLCPIVFESRGSIGGVWINTLETTKLQTPKSFYQFTDFPWPSSVVEDFPSGQQVHDYIHSYATHFDLLKYIRFSCKVESLSYEGPSDEEMEAWSLWGGTGEPLSSRGKWNLSVQDTQALSTQVHQVDFVILCIGRFSDVPNIPEFPHDMGPEEFHGKVIHSMVYAEMDNETAAKFIEGKKVTVVGLQKSALDIAMECSSANGSSHPCTVIYRTEHWNIPDYLPWGVPLAYLYLNRFSELLVHKPGEGFVLALLASILSPLRWGISKFVESYVKWKLQLGKFSMVPKHSFLTEMNSCLTSTVPQDFYKRVEGGSIILKKSQSFCFNKEGVLLDNDKAEVVKADLVILATGFKGVDKLKDIFLSPTLQTHISGRPENAVPLYRECIQPRVPQLAIIGFSESISNLFTSELRCQWLVELLDGSFKLPNISEMEKDVAKWDEFMKEYSGKKYYRRSCIGALHIWYNDQLYKDMGRNPRRKDGIIAELFQPYGPVDYACLS